MFSCLPLLIYSFKLEYCVCVCVCVCLRANQMLLTLCDKVDQGLLCERYHISRSSGKALLTLGGSQTLIVE